MILRFLGTHNAESISTRLASFLIDEILAVDAGSLASELSFLGQDNIRAILLSHGHYDHIRDIPTFAFANSHHMTKVFGTRRTLEILTSHLLDGLVYPKFGERTPFLEKPALELVPLTTLQPVDIEGYRVLAIPVNHPLDAVGFEITSPHGKTIFYTGDTGSGLRGVWKQVSPQLLVAELTFPNALEQFALESRHLCPNMLREELKAFRVAKGFLPRVVLTHLSPRFEEDIRSEVAAFAEVLGVSISLASEGMEFVI